MIPVQAASEIARNSWKKCSDTFWATFDQIWGPKVKKFFLQRIFFMSSLRYLQNFQPPGNSGGQTELPILLKCITWPTDVSTLYSSLIFL